jgi:hypothetical protein
VVWPRRFEELIEDRVGERWVPPEFDH